MTLVLYPGIRSPMGRFGGHFQNISPMRIMAELIPILANRLGFSLEESGEVFFGQCRQAGHGPNPARSAALWGGIPEHVPCSTLNAACPSGLLVLRSALAGEPNKVIWAGGMDSMSTIPYLLKGCRFSGFKMGNRVLEDGWSDSIDPVIQMGMGQTAEEIVGAYQIDRQEMDRYAKLSQDRAIKTEQKGGFGGERVAVLGLEKDETPRLTNLEKLATLPPVFGGEVTAGNACSMADAAAVYVLADQSRFPDSPCFKVRQVMAHACAPRWMGLGPGQAIQRCWREQGLNASDIGVYEINEAFAVQVLANLRDTDLDIEQVNQRGGAIALGHPTGMSGARLLVSAMDQMIETDCELGLVTLCGAGGITGLALLQRIR
ncbi:MAG: thiolase family protein [Acidobacteria bacterium]|nr:thiolase family protein [Acidobacteriota bacterium]